MADLEFRRVQDEPPLYDLYIGGKIAGHHMTLDQVVREIAGKGDGNDG